MQRDLVLRWLEQISALIAKLLRGDPGINLLLVEERLSDAVEQVLGPLRGLIERLEPESAAELLGDPFRIHGYAQLIAFQSAVARARGRTGEAGGLGRRALALAREACRRSDPVPAEWSEWVERLEAELGESAGPPEAA